MRWSVCALSVLFALGCGVAGGPIPQPGDTKAVDVGGGLTMELVWIPPGTFMMGSPSGEEGHGADEAHHRVTLSRGFWMGKYEITQAQCEAVMGSNPSHFKGDKDLPVEQVSWDGARAFCEVLSRKAGAEFRLPTEAEWEYACRAGTTTPFHLGETISTDQANYDGNDTYGNGRKGEYREKTTPVGSFPANAWGLHDMHGNVCEWCEDWYDTNYYANSPERDPRGPRPPTSCSHRVIRGGCWRHVPRSCRAADRAGSTPDERDDGRGFRVASSAVQ
ncbi:MAG: formylglycine-generating enzyme family protein [Candidatus Hydrogenedentes bacterium]|nr:formylglycine-generating enzyme family protein [Candidatus Hydrogenedentota bacterium]